MKKLIGVLLILVTVFAMAIPAFADHAAGFLPASTDHSAGFGIPMWVNCPDGYGLNVHEEPSLSGKFITQLDCGTEVTLLADCSKSWVYISGGKVSGYVMRRFLQSTQPDKYEITERDDRFVAVSPYIVCARALSSGSVTSAGLRVRPNRTSQAIRRLAAGDELRVIARGEIWSRVVDPVTGKTGYVANDYLTIL